MQRIVVIGATGAGKTTMAWRLSSALALPRVEMDALFWEPRWQSAPDDVFRERVERATSGESWVVDGNYSRMRDLVWSSADTIVWLDYPLRVTLRRLWWRTLSRWVTRRELWSGNRSPCACCSRKTRSSGGRRDTSGASTRSTR